MAFPETDRVVYERNTLEEVKSQIRFPPILSIEASTPATFQEQIREEFPYFEVKSPVKLPPGVPTGVAQAFERDFSLVTGKTYAFSSDDRMSALVLSKDQLSLVTRRYERWEGFRSRLAKALESFAGTYHPSFFNHVCVRYKNSIRREPLGLSNDVRWSDLVQPWILGPLAVTSTAERVEAIQATCVIQLPAINGKIAATFALGIHQPSKEPAFIIDAHVFNDVRKEITDVLPCLDTLHHQAGLFFRWCIKDQLHCAMRPTPS